MVATYDLHVLMKIGLICTGFQNIFGKNGLIHLALRAHLIRNLRNIIN